MKSPISISETFQPNDVDYLTLESRTVILQPLAMIIPNCHSIYSPSKLRPKIKISYDEFLSRYADYPIEIRVCFDEASSVGTLLKNSKAITAYGFGLDSWYIIDASLPEC